MLFISGESCVCTVAQMETLECLIHIHEGVWTKTVTAAVAMLFLSKPPHEYFYFVSRRPHKWRRWCLTGISFLEKLLLE